MSVFIHQDHANQSNSGPSARKLIFIALINLPDFTDDYIYWLFRFNDVINGDDVVIKHWQPEHILQSIKYYYNQDTVLKTPIYAIVETGQSSSSTISLLSNVVAEAFINGNTIWQIFVVANEHSTSPGQHRACRWKESSLRCSRQETDRTSAKNKQVLHKCLVHTQIFTQIDSPINLYLMFE